MINNQKIENISSFFKIICSLNVLKNNYINVENDLKENTTYKSYF